MTEELERDLRTEELLMKSRRLREELAAMVSELEGFVIELDTFIARTPEESE